MCRRPSTTSTASNSIVQQLGGENPFNFLLMTFCENIQDDPKLQEAMFKGMDLETLNNMMSSLVHTALDERNASLFDDEDARNRLVLNNYSLLELGIMNNGVNHHNFQRLQTHLESALRDSWVEEDLMEKCIHRFGAMLPILEEEGLELEKTMMTHRVVATRILVAASSSG